PDPTASPAPGLSVSSCTITASTGARSVVSTNARTATDPAALDVYASRAGDGREPPPDVVLIDGHNPALAALALDLAAGADAFTVMDAGSWKDDAADLPGRCDVVAASARFYPPGPAGPLTGPAEAARWLREAGAGGVVITRGARPALWWCTADHADGHAESRTGGHDGIHGSVIPPQVEVADTLGAGDVFHGALAHALAHVTPGRLTGAGLAAAVERACVIAATSTEVFGTRAWRQRLET
ncbi:PfkB family carbohydrate kinase, partial [Actinomyces sp. oral taxon 448]